MPPGTFFSHLDCIFSTELPPPIWQTKGSEVHSDSKALLCKGKSLLIEFSFLVPSLGSTNSFSHPMNHLSVMFSDTGALNRKLYLDQVNT